jgi:hypothetical protein
MISDPNIRSIRSSPIHSIISNYIRSIRDLTELIRDLTRLIRPIRSVKMSSVLNALGIFEDPAIQDEPLAKMIPKSGAVGSVKLHSPIQNESVELSETDTEEWGCQCWYFKMHVITSIWMIL